MKTLNANAQTKVAEAYGTEPVTIIGITWAGSELFYADKDIENIQGKIIDMGEIDSVLTISNSPSSAVSVRLSDIDGSIKGIFDSNNIQKAACTIYQGYGNLAVADKFVIYKGEVSTPFDWSEGDRTVGFNIVTEIEGREVGFSPEEAQFDFVSPDLIGEAWPLAYGHVVHVPATKVRQIATGELQDYMCILDPNLVYQLNALRRALNDEQMIQAYYMSVISNLNDLAPDPQLLIFIYTFVIRALGGKQGELNNLDQRIDIQLQLRDNAPTRRIRDAAEAERRRLITIRVNQAAAAEIQAVFDATVARINTFIAAAQNQLINQKNNKASRDALNNAINDWEQQLQQALADLNGQLQGLNLPLVSNLQALNNLKEWVEERITYAKWIYTRKMKARQEVLRSIDFQKRIYSSYTQIQIEVCKQSNSVKNSVTILKGSTFESGTITLTIKGVNWRGSFSNNIFTFDTPGFPTAQYTDLDLDTWVAPVNECGYIDEMSGMDIFYLDDATINLKGMYIWATDIFENRHFLKVIDQDGAKCTFELKVLGQLDGSNSGNNIVRSSVSLPTYSTPFGPIGFNISNILPGFDNEPVQELDPAIVALLGGVPINQKEWDNLAALQKLYWSPATMLVPLPGPADVYTTIGPHIASIVEAASIVLPHWFDEDYPVHREELPASLFWEAEPGTNVRSADDTAEIYVANILPSTIKAVYGYRKYPGPDTEHVLTPIPSHYYTSNEAEVLNADLTVTSLKMKRPLSQIGGEKWKDDVYVSMDSSEGPSVTDILTHLIVTYTDYTADATTFGAVDTLLTNYPANFALFNRTNIYTILSEIAFQARCSLYLRSGVFYITYLGEVPTPVATITESDIELESLRLTISSTDDLVTKMDVTWREHYLPDSERKFIIRHNVSTYGIYEQAFDFYIYNDETLVIKMSTFWMIRLANTWKRISFSTFLTNLEIDTADAVTLDFNTTYFADADVLAVIDSAGYDSNSKTIMIEAQLPVRSGEMELYPFYWPSAVAATLEFPTSEDDGGGPWGDLTIQDVTGE